MNGMNCEKLLDRVMSAEAAASLIQPDMTVGFSGFTRAGYPKAVPQAIAAQGTAKNLTVITGASTGPELDSALAQAGLIGKRMPFQTDKNVRTQINDGSIAFVDTHLGHMPRYIRQGFVGPVHYAIVECSEITADGGIVLTTSAGLSDTLLTCAENIILEVNQAYHQQLTGIHDIYMESDYPNRREIPIYAAADRAGAPCAYCDLSKIRAIVMTDKLDAPVAFTEADENSKRIAGYIIRLFEEEVRAGRLPENLLPLQSGVGSVANAVLSGLKDTSFQNLTMYTEVVQDSALQLIREGKIGYASCTALSLSKEGQEEFLRNIDFYRRHLVLRPQNISNSGEVVQRLGVIAMNTAVEFDLYGNVNSTNVLGSQLINGIGGSGDFARNARLTIFSTVSTAKKGGISSVVPLVSHVDHVEHDVHIVVTEQGLADLRGKSAKERAECIIENCCHPDYRPALREYYEYAKKNSYGMNIPLDLYQALSWHQKYAETSSMR